MTHRLLGILAFALFAVDARGAAPACDSDPTFSLSYAVYWINRRHIPLSGNLPWLSDSKTSEEMRSDLADAETVLVDVGMDIQIVGNTLAATEIAPQHTTSIYLPFRLIYLGASRSRNIKKLKDRLVDHGYYDSEKLNIYFVPDADVKGYHLREPNGNSMNIVFVGNGGEPDSIAHELGHAFSLQHVNFWDSSLPSVEYCVEYEYWDNDCDFQRDNVMWAGWTDRNKLFEGQLERAMCNPNSALVVNGDLSTPWTGRCPEFSEAGSCEPAHPP